MGVGPVHRLRAFVLAVIGSMLLQSQCVSLSTNGTKSTFTFTDITMDAGGWVTGISVHPGSGHVLAMAIGILRLDSFVEYAVNRTRPFRQHREHVADGGG